MYRYMRDLNEIEIGYDNLLKKVENTECRLGLPD